MLVNEIYVATKRVARATSLFILSALISNFLVLKESHYIVHLRAKETIKAFEAVGFLPLQNPFGVINGCL